MWASGVLACAVLLCGVSAVPVAAATPLLHGLRGRHVVQEPLQQPQQLPDSSMPAVLDFFNGSEAVGAAVSEGEAHRRRLALQDDIDAVTFNGQRQK